MYYFAYGLHLNKQMMKEHCPGSKPLYPATLPNYKLIFVGWSRKFQGGAASIQRSQGSKVPGAVYEISESGLRHLDIHEGYPHDYVHLKVIVFDEDGNPIEATTYIKTSREEESKPSKEYASTIYQGYKDWGLV
jgi:gamma-glutamylcyclotransferase